MLIIGLYGWMWWRMDHRLTLQTSTMQTSPQSSAQVQLQGVRYSSSFPWL